MDLLKLNLLDLPNLRQQREQRGKPYSTEQAKGAPLPLRKMEKRLNWLHLYFQNSLIKLIHSLLWRERPTMAHLYLEGTSGVGEKKQPSLTRNRGEETDNCRELATFRTLASPFKLIVIVYLYKTWWDSYAPFFRWRYWGSEILSILLNLSLIRRKQEEINSITFLLQQGYKCKGLIILP